VVTADSKGLLIADAHVHVHPCFSAGRLLRIAADNLERAARRAAPKDGTPRLGYLLLTEAESEPFFERFAGGIVRATGWKFRATAEDECLLAEDERGRNVILVAGRQLATSDGLEVLAIGTRRALPSGLPFADTLREANEAAAVVVVPWGFGKWWGRRGRLVESTVASAPAWPMTFLGDNGGRLRGLRPPRLFQLAESIGVRVLPGSDALPFPDQLDKVGRSGFVIEGCVDRTRPLDALVGALRAGAVVRPFHTGESILPFARNQVKMQFIKRMQKRP
jgi:hypothetical protein